METKIFMLSGIIFQQRQMFGTRHDASMGLRATIENGIVYGVFQAVIVTPAEEDEMGVCGQMQDRWGYAEISQFKLTDDRLEYVKTYDGRPPIYYLFDKKEDDVWLGNYEGVDCGSGPAKCYVREVPEAFFEPEQKKSTA